MSETSSREARGRRILSLAGAVILGLILIVATIGKMFEPIVFLEQVRNEGLDFLFSASTVVLLALAIEMGLGVALLLGMRNLWVLIPTAGLVAFFMLLTGRGYYLVLTGVREDTYECGCFGIFMQRTVVEAFWQDLFLLVLPLLMAFASTTALRKPLSTWKTTVAAVSALGVVLYTVLAVGLPTEPDRRLFAMIEEPESGFRESDEFGLLVDGVDDPGARVLESEATLRFVILSPRLSDALLLDVRTGRVFALDPDHIEKGEVYELTPRARLNEVGAFEVGAEGIALSHQGRTLVMRPRGMRGELE